MRYEYSPEKIDSILNRSSGLTSTHISQAKDTLGLASSKQREKVQMFHESGDIGTLQADVHRATLTQT